MKIVSRGIAPRQSLSREIYDRLETAIILGRLEPGVRLAEDVIAHAFSVSRSPVREAIAELQRVGFAERGASRDRRVTVPTRDYIIDCFDVWVMLEAERLHEASIHSDAGSIADIDRISAALEEHYAKKTPPPADLLSQFHASLRRDCRNQQLQRLGDEWSRYIRWLQNLYFQYEMQRPGEASLEHGQIVERFKARDKPGLVKALQQHVLRQRDEILLRWQANMLQQREEALTVEVGSLIF